MKKFVFLLILVIFSFGWELKKNEEGISVYTQKVQNSKYDAFKAETVVKKPFNEVKKALLNFKDYPKWQKKIDKIYVKNGYVLKILDFPFPLSDRFAFYKLKITKKPGLLVVKLSSVPYKELPQNVKKEFKKPDCVEMKDNVTFKAEEEKNGVKIVYSAVVDPNGVPAFIFNSKIIEAGYSTLKNLKNYLK